MGRSKVYEDRVEVGLRLPRQLHQRLKEHLAAATPKVSQNEMVERLITKFLADASARAGQGGDVTQPLDWGKAPAEANPPVN